MIRLALVEDQHFIRRSLSAKLEDSEEVDLLFSAQNGEDFLLKLSSSKALPEVVVMDIEMPVMDGIKAVRSAKEAYPELQFVMLTVFESDEKIFEAIQAGASGYLLKEEPVDRIIQACHEVANVGGSPMSPSIARKVLSLLRRPKPLFGNSPADEYGLSEREVEILELLINGQTYKQMAESLFISPHTVRTHIGNVYKKLHVKSKASAIKLAHKRKWF